MPRVNEIYGGNSLNAQDLPQGRDIPVTIQSCVVKEYDEGNKLVLTFYGKDKTLPLNVTNAVQIANLLGTDQTENWQGQSLFLYVTKVPFNNKMVDAIRIRDYQPASAAQPRQVASGRGQGFTPISDQTRDFTPPLRTFAQPAPRPEPVAAGPGGPPLDTPLTDDDIPF